MLVPYHEAMNINRTATVMVSKESAAYTVKFYPNGIINPSTFPSYSNALKAVLLVSDVNEKLCLRTHLKKDDILHGSIIVRDDIYASIMGDNEDIELWEAYVNSFYHDELKRFITIDYACPARKKEVEEEKKKEKEEVASIADKYWSHVYNVCTDGFNQAYVTFDEIEITPTLNWP